MPNSRTSSRATTPKGRDREPDPSHPGAGTLFVHRTHLEHGIGSVAFGVKDKKREEEEGIFDWDELAKVGIEPIHGCRKRTYAFRPGQNHVWYTHLMYSSKGVLRDIPMRQEVFWAKESSVQSTKYTTRTHSLSVFLLV
jgi:hypothetical protein